MTNTEDKKHHPICRKEKLLILRHDNNRYFFDMNRKWHCDAKSIELEM